MTSTNELTVAVVGSRSFRDYRLMCKELDTLRKEKSGYTLRFVSGGAQGADKLAEQYAEEHDLKIDVLKPDWRPNGVYDPQAGLNRNTDIVQAAQMVIAFWDGVSTGTRDTKRKAENLGLETRVIRY